MEAKIEIIEKGLLITNYIIYLLEESRQKTNNKISTSIYSFILSISF